jgi:hypothetical protein
MVLALAAVLAACGITPPQPSPSEGRGREGSATATDDYLATLAICCPRSQSTPMSPSDTPAPTATLPPTATVPPSPTADTRLKPEAWKEWPVLPTLSAKMKALYAEGLKQGNNPRAFSKIGDCQNITSHFLGFFDKPGFYNLGAKYASLQATIDQFKGSFGRDSASVRAGFNVAAVLSPLQADPAVCKAGETPLQCEFRLNKPSIAIISMETWWAKKPADEYARYMRQIIEFVLAQKVVPIIATKADNLEEDFSVNLAIAGLAYEYDIPLWNFWLAVQPLPYHGLNDDGFHLTNDLADPNDPLLYRRLSEPLAEKVAWPVRNITALQALEAVWRQATRP